MLDRVFYDHGRMLLMALIVGAALTCVFVACMRALSQSMPSRVTVRLASGAIVDPRDPYQDDWPRYPAPKEPDAMMAGGSEIMRGVDDNMDRLKRYNAAVRKTSHTTFGAPMLESVIDRGSLFEPGDEWGPEAAAPPADPTPMTKEVTLFSF